LAAPAAALNGPDRLVFHGAYTVDTAGNFARIIILYASLLLFSTLGQILFTGAADVMLLVVAYLLSSV
jgi:hypothetical protein